MTTVEGPGWTMELYQDGNKIDEKVTDANGNTIQEQSLIEVDLTKPTLTVNEIPSTTTTPQH